MKFAGIHKDNKGYIFAPLSKAVAGFLVSTEPEVRIYRHDEAAKIAGTLREVLNASREKVPNPAVNAPSEEEKQRTKEKLRRLDLKSFNYLNKKPVLFCWVESDGENIFFQPSAYDVSGKGYVKLANEKKKSGFSSPGQ